jgi:hypothetical protein
MKEFVLIFRTAPNPDFKPSQQQQQEMMTSWMNWMGNIEKDGKLANKGTRLGISNSKVVLPNNVVTNGPYTEIKEFLNGYIVVKTNSIDEAVAIAQQNPMVIGGGGNIEIRPAVSPDDNS